MPSQKVLEEKQQIVADLVERLKSSTSGVLVEYKGITVEDDTALRRELRAAGVEYSVKKNTLIRRAANEIGLSGLDDVLHGTTALATSADLVAPAKILSKYAATHEKFKIKAGFVEGNVIDAEGVKQLAEMPPKEVLIAKVLGGFNAPISGFVNVLNGNIRGLAVALGAILEKKSA